MARVLALPRFYRETLVAFDPGLTSLRGALRGTLAVLISFFILSFGAKAFHQPPTLAFLGVLIAMMGSLVVNDPTRKQQMKTMAILPFPAGLAFAASIALEPWSHARLGGFLIVTFLAVSLRRFGLRWMGLGIMTFMAYFSPLFFPIHRDSIPWVLLAVLVSTAVSFVVRFYILPDRPKTLIRLYLQGFQNLQRDIMREVAKALRTFEPQDAAVASVQLEKARARIGRLFTKLNEMSLSAEQFLDNGDARLEPPKVEALKMQLFEQELSLRQYLDVARDHAPRLTSEQARRVAEASELVGERADFEKAPGNLEAEVESFLREPELSDFKGSLLGLVRMARKPLPTPEEIGTLLENASQKPVPAPVAMKREALHVSTRQAIQATLATALASVIGMSVSPERWYWASIAAFMVFVGASRGETTVRAIIRILGTVGGLVVGFLVAYLLRGHHGLEWTMVVSSIFFALFASRIAFGFWTAALFTLMVAVLFDVLGQLSVQILVLRLEETLVGAAIGGIVGAYVLPTSTRGVIRGALAKFLRTAGSAIEELPGGSPSPFSRRELVRRLREADRSLMALRMAVAPVLNRSSLMRQDEIPGALYDATAIAHYLRQLVVYKGPLQGLSEEKFRATCEHLFKELRRLADELEAEKRPAKPERVSGDKAVTSGAATPAHWLDRVEQLVQSLERRRV